MDVVLPVGGQVVVDDKGDLLHVNATSKQVGGDQNPRRAAAELPHDHVPLLLVHVAVHGRHCEVALVHLLSQPVDLPPGVAEDDGLGDGEGLVEVAQGVKLPLLTLDRDVELANTLEGELLLLDEDADGVPHEPGGHLKHLLGHCGGQQDHLFSEIMLGLTKTLDSMLDYMSGGIILNETTTPPHQSVVDNIKST